MPCVKARPHKVPSSCFFSLAILVHGSMMHMVSLPWISFIDTKIISSVKTKQQCSLVEGSHWWDHHCSQVKYTAAACAVLPQAALSKGRKKTQAECLLNKTEAVAAKALVESPEAALEAMEAHILARKILERQGDLEAQALLLMLSVQERCAVIACVPVEEKLRLLQLLEHTSERVMAIMAMPEHEQNIIVPQLSEEDQESAISNMPEERQEELLDLLGEIQEGRT